MTLWGSRFRDKLSELAFRFSSSLDVDKRFYKEDIDGSKAHVEMLAAQGILSRDEAGTIISALDAIRMEIENGTLLVRDAEDIHTFIEEELQNRIGEVAGKLHSGRSRNDQIALDERLYLRSAIDSICSAIRGLQRALLDQAELHCNTILPGFTHLQHAQPILLAHHLIAYVEMLDRDRERFLDCRKRSNHSPLGAAALAGTSLPIDRSSTAKKLGFDEIIKNSIDAVSDRDALIEFVSGAAIAMVHLSRLAEELVLWSSPEFNFVEIPDAFATGSSIMPQKKNPDIAELIRGKSASVIGDLVTLLTIMKGLPLAYNRDLQEGKAPLFHAHDTLEQSLIVMAAMIASLKFNAGRMREMAAVGFTTATDLAEHLVKKGMPFREAHRLVGEIVRYALESGKSFSDLTVEELKRFSSMLDDQAFKAMDISQSVNAKQSEGGTSTKEVRKQLEYWKKLLKVALS